MGLRDVMQCRFLRACRQSLALDSRCTGTGGFILTVTCYYSCILEDGLYIFIKSQNYFPWLPERIFGD